jgi:hypothetical protein
MNRTCETRRSIFVGAIVLSAVGSIASCALLNSCSGSKSSAERGQMHANLESVRSEAKGEITVRLLQSYDTLEGIQRAGRPPTDDPSSVYSAEKTIVRIVTPEGKEVRIPSRATFVTINRGVITDVMTTPISSSFREVVAALRSVMEENDILPTPIMEERLSRLPKDQPGNERYGGAGGAHIERVGDGVVSSTIRTYVTINPAPGGGWYLSMSFGVPIEEYWKLYPPEQRPKDYK